MKSWVDFFKNLIRYSVVVTILALILIVTLIFLNVLSCVSTPKQVQGEPLICEKSSQWAYLAVMDKSGKFPESVSTSGVYSCVDTLKVQMCNNERLKFFQSNPPTGDKYNDLVNENRARKIYDECLADMKR